MSSSAPSLIGKRATRFLQPCAWGAAMGGGGGSLGGGGLSLGGGGLSWRAGGFHIVAVSCLCMALFLEATALAGGDDRSGDGVVSRVDPLKGAANPVPHSYELWSGGALFNEDANGDGVANGVAWLLGAPDKDVNAASLVPTVMRFEDSLVLSFACLRLTCREGAVLKLQVMDGRAGDDPWVSHEAEVPDSGGSVNGASFVVTPHENPRLIHVVVTIKGMLGEQPFARLVGILP